jgi:hypothetical protein
VTTKAESPHRAQRAAAGSRKPAVIGWNEHVDLPDWHIRGLKAKIDTGARSSALHVDGLKVLPRRRLEFQVVLHRHHHDRRIHVVAPIARRSRVRSSTGEYSVRYFVVTRLRMAGIENEIEISLVDRSDMLFRMLVGRTALAGTYLVDPAHKNLGKPAQLRARRKSGRIGNR